MTPISTLESMLVDALETELEDYQAATASWAACTAVLNGLRERDAEIARLRGIAPAPIEPFEIPGPESVVSSLDIVAEFGDQCFAQLRKEVGWFDVDDGKLIANNEYFIDSAKAVKMAILLLGCARRLRKI